MRFDWSISTRGHCRFLYIFLVISSVACFSLTRLRTLSSIPCGEKFKIDITSPCSQVSQIKFITHRSLLRYSSKDDDIYERDQSQKYTSPFSSRNKHWIVLVDDEESIRLALGEFLYSSGYSVTACADPEALFHLLSSTDKEPDVIVSDIRMPNSSIDGLKLLSLLKGNDPNTDEYYRWRNIPVILLTAKSLTPDRIQGYRLGAQAYLSKPFAPEELLSVIDNLIKRRVDQSSSDLDAKALQVLSGELKGIKSLLIQSSPDQKVADAGNSDQGVETTETQTNLTPTEVDVLRLLCDGLSNSEIAEKRGKSPIGIGKVISRLYLKTQTKTRTELVRWAAKNEYIK